jgi:hypothetical protein
MAVISASEKAHVYDMQNMPEDARAFLFPLHEYRYKLHSGIFISAAIAICLMFLYCYIVLGARDTAYFGFGVLALMAAALINWLSMTFLNFTYKRRNGKMKDKRQPSSYPFSIVCHAGFEWGFRCGDELNISRLKAILRRQEGIKFARDVFNSLSCEIGFERIGLYDRGKKVKMIQRYLGMKQTGRYDMDTQDAVKELQAKLSMDQDGIFSPKITERAVACLEVIYSNYMADGSYALKRDRSGRQTLYPTGLA